MKDFTDGHPDQPGVPGPDGPTGNEYLSDYDNNLLLDPDSNLSFYGAARSSQWPKVRDEWLKLNNFCAACGGTVNLAVHHIRPFHLYPELELDTTNFLTLCSKSRGGVNCHLIFGHLGNWEYYFDPASIRPFVQLFRTNFNKPHRGRV